MTPEQIEQERQAFEAWAKEMGDDDRLTRCENDNSMDYEDISIEYAWNGWKARSAKSAWVSVDDRLPESNGDFYLVFTDKRMTTECRFMAGNFITTYCKNQNVTHWQPLPEPPKDTNAT